MAVSARRVAQVTRYNVGDANHTRYSDYEILSALNAAILAIVDSANKYYVPLLVTTETLETEERPDGLKEVELPEDFGAIMSVECTDGVPLVSNYESSLYDEQYRIEGRKILCWEDFIVLTYRKEIPELNSFEKDIEDFPSELTLPLAKITSAFILGDMTAVEIESDKAVISIKNRRYENNRPPKLWGGYNEWV